MSVVNQVMIIFAGVNGYMDDVGTDQVVSYEEGLIEYLTINKSQMITNILESGKIEGENEEELKTSILEFNKTFVQPSQNTEVTQVNNG